MMTITKNPSIWRHMEAKRPCFPAMMFCITSLLCTFLNFSQTTPSKHTHTHTHSHCLILTICFLSLKTGYEARIPFFRVCELLWGTTKNMCLSKYTNTFSLRARGTFLIFWYKEQSVQCALILHSHISAAGLRTTVLALYGQWTSGWDGLCLHTAWR